ncbi:MAG: hypothetical protein AVDCRST_MAG64-267, partial [uncultured Phycisphaerae bacterium]
RGRAAATVRRRGAGRRGRRGPGGARRHGARRGGRPHPADARPGVHARQRQPRRRRLARQAVAEPRL